MDGAKIGAPRPGHLPTIRIPGIEGCRLTTLVPAHVPAEHRLVEEHQRDERLGLGGGCHVARGGEVIHEGFDFCCAHRVRMALAVKQRLLFHPVAVALFGARAEVAPAASDGHTVEQAGGRCGKARQITP